MVSRWKKLTYSLASILVGTATFAILLGISTRNPSVGGTFVMFAAAVAGWIVAIPLILRINNVSGWRFWLYLGIGTSTGPTIVFLALLVPFIKRAIQIDHTQNSAVAIVTLIALGLFAIPFFVGSLTYLLCLRKAQTSVLKRMSVATR